MQKTQIETSKIDIYSPFVGLLCYLLPLRLFLNEHLHLTTELNTQTSRSATLCGTPHFLFFALQQKLPNAIG
jgi:hypothetical protein